MSEAALGSAIGLSPEERDELMAKCASGDMNFDDFLKIYAVMNRMGGAKGAVDMFSKFAQVPGAGDISGSQVDEKMKGWSTIIDAMEDDVRQNPELVLSGPDKEKRIVAISKAAGVGKE